jgi:outer membrane receptor protein involved in Fe transport
VNVSRLSPAALRVVLCLAATAVTALAQTAPATPPEEAVVLSPFEVNSSKDVGYVATSSLAGGRTEMSLKQTAAAISVFTREFLDDIGGESLTSVAQWGLNMDPKTDANTGLQGEYNVNFRGLGGSFPSRNYFVWYVDSDSYVTERYEFARGPNSVLFGDGNVGGIQTTWTKRPLYNTQRRSLEAKVDSWGGWRTSFDVNHSLTPKVALRVAGLYQDYPGWRDDSVSKRHGAFLNAGWRPFAQTEIRLEGENGRVERSLFPNTFSDQASYWNKTTVNNGITTPSTTGTGIGRVATTAYYLVVPGIPNSGFQDWRNSFRTNGSGLAIADRVRPNMETLPLLPSREFNLQPTDSLAILDYETTSLFLDQRLPGGFFVQVAGNILHNDRHGLNNSQNFGEYRIDINQLLPDGRPNPKFGVPFADQTRQNAKAENHVSDLRALLNWRRRFSWVNQTASLIAGRRVDRFDSWTRVLHRVNGPNPDQTSADNQFRMRLYWDEPRRYSAALMPQVPGWDFAFEDTAISHQRKTLDYIQVAAVSQLFKDRLNVVIGARRDDLTNRQETTSGIPTAAVTRAPQLGAVVINPATGRPEAIAGAVGLNTFTPTSYNVGAVYFVLPWLGLTSNFSETFSTPNNGTNLLDGTPPGISKSTGKDFGVRLDLLEGRVYVSLNRYSSKQVDRLITGLRITEINRIWTNLNRVDLANVNYRDLESVSGSGYEMEVTANPTRALRLMFNLALPRTLLDSNYEQLRRYFAANLAQWQAGATDTTNPNRGQINTDLTNIQNDLNNAVVGTLLNNTTKYTGNTYATYTFPRGVLRGVAFGAGINVRGPNKVAAATGSPFSYLYADSYKLVSAHLNYSRRFGRINARFQLNVSNVLDDETLVLTGYNTYRAGNIATNPLITAPSAYRYNDPRKFTLTANFGF